jgi:23S rRNA pseudouridine1911/1915/1917 synthase
MRDTMGGAFTFVVSQRERGKRLDRFLQEQDLSLSRSRIKQLIEGGQFRVNDRQVKAGARLKPGDRITGEVPPPRPLEARAEDIPIQILHEDSHIVVVNKAAGMVVHPAPGVPSGTLVNALLFHCKDLSGINGVLRPGIVHRLDRYTSGVMVAAKNDLAHEALVRQFRHRTVEKRYLALVYGRVDDQEGLVTASMGRHPKKRTQISIQTRSPKEAITRWRNLDVLPFFTLLEIFPKTGRTHQIRVHLSSIGHPIMGDPVYCDQRHVKQIGEPGIRARVEGFKRQALHASALIFRHPQNGEPVEFHAPLPSDMEEIIAFLREKEESPESRDKRRGRKV